MVKTAKTEQEEPNEASFLNDAHKDLRADYIIANPLFNDSDRSGELLRDNARW